MPRIPDYPEKTSLAATDLFVIEDVASNTTKRVKFSNMLSVPDASYTTIGNTVNTVTNNGNRSYSLVFNSVDLTSTLSAGMRLRCTRTATAPTQSTSLNGTSQYYSKTSPAGMTFTDDFTVSAWIKVTSYANAVIASRWNGTSGWSFELGSNGQPVLIGWNGGSSNLSQVQSYQSVPLNKWIHVSAQLDMSAFTATTTTSYVMIDGVDASAVVTRGGTNPTALVQAGDLQIGTKNGANFFPGKIAQVAIYSAKITQANIRATMGQTLSGAETSLISAYSFNNVITDLNTSNANNLTANGSAVATNADTPFAGGSVGTTEYAIITGVAFSTNTTVTVQVPEGGALPTTGGISAVSYSGHATPYGFPKQTGKWIIETIVVYTLSVAVAALNTNYDSGIRLNIPIGSWEPTLEGIFIFTSTTTGTGNANEGKVFVANTSSVTDTIRKLGLRAQSGNTAQQTAAWMSGQTTDTLTLTSATSYSVWYNQLGYTGGAAGFQAIGDQTTVSFHVKNAYL